MGRFCQRFSAIIQQVVNRESPEVETSFIGLNHNTTSLNALFEQQIHDRFFVSIRSVSGELFIGIRIAFKYTYLSPLLAY